jgi:hypothetical protein
MTVGLYPSTLLFGQRTNKIRKSPKIKNKILPFFLKSSFSNFQRKIKLTNVAANNPAHEERVRVQSRAEKKVIIRKK